MADFEPAFALLNGTKRYPSEAEANSGFACGPADRDLFNGIMHQICAELGEVITWGGIVHTNDRMTLVREALESKIKGVKITKIDIPFATVNDSFASVNLLSTTYNRVYSNSTVFATIYSEGSFGVNKLAIANKDVKGLALFNSTINAFTQAHITAEFNSITSSAAPVNDLVLANYSGSRFRGSYSEDLTISVDMKVETATVEDTTATMFALKHRHGYIQITEIQT